MPWFRHPLLQSGNSTVRFQASTAHLFYSAVHLLGEALHKKVPKSCQKPAAIHLKIETFHIKN